MVLVVFGVALLVLAAAMVVLFAMMGELASRVPGPSTTRRDATVRALDEAQLGSVPSSWPPGLEAGNGNGNGNGSTVLLVLSTICATCADIATQLTENPGHADWGELGVVVSTSNQGRGNDFVARHGLGAFRHFVDTGGDWVSDQFGVRVSPTALVFTAGRLESAYVFYDVAALRAKIKKEREDRQMQREDSQMQKEPT